MPFLRLSKALVRPGQPGNWLSRRGTVSAEPTDSFTRLNLAISTSLREARGGRQAHRHYANVKEGEPIGAISYVIPIE